jgi:hypothetical protein
MAAKPPQSSPAKGTAGDVAGALKLELVLKTNGPLSGFQEDRIRKAKGELWAEAIPA